MEKRRVMVMKATRYEKTDSYEATFHGWGVNFEEFETGPGNYSCAIVENKDGSVELEPANLIRFLDTDLALRED